MIIFKILRKERLSFLAKMKSKEPIYSSASLNNWKKVGGGDEITAFQTLDDRQ